MSRDWDELELKDDGSVYFKNALVARLVEDNASAARLEEFKILLRGYEGSRRMKEHRLLHEQASRVFK